MTRELVGVVGTRGARTTRHVSRSLRGVFRPSCATRRRQPVHPRPPERQQPQIDAADGTVFKEVANDDQEPTHVILPKGTYTVVARSDTSGKVSVPVAIETGKTTVLHLEREKDWKDVAAGIRSADLVRLPNGQPIGFRARHAEFRDRTAASGH